MKRASPSESAHSVDVAAPSQIDLILSMVGQCDFCFTEKIGR